MRTPESYIDDGWDWLLHAKDEAETDRTQTAYTARNAVNENSPVHVARELGLVLLVPLAGAGLVELVLRALRIY